MNRPDALRPADPLVVSLVDVIHVESPQCCGSKALNLSRLMQIGLPVPHGFCVTPTLWREHVQSNGLIKQIERLLGVAASAADRVREEALAELRQGIMASHFTAEHRSSLETPFTSLRAKSVAVRSSAQAEDLADHSFAGLYDTVLGVVDFPECLEAIKRCWASQWNHRAFEYLCRSGMDPALGSMAVIVQSMAPAESSGIIFTADPTTGRQDRITIESTRGLGEPLVSGRVAPDRLVLSRPNLEILDTRLGDKGIQLTLNAAHQVEESALPPRERSEPSLDLQAAQDLSRMAIVAEDEFGFPLDIEFALVEKNPILLQARPITATPTPDSNLASRQVWTNANTGEVVPDVVTPLTWSVVQPLGEHLLGTIFGRLGIQIGDHPLFGLVAGRAYFNLNTLIACVRSVPGLNANNITELFGGRQDVAAELGKVRLTEEDIPDIRCKTFALLMLIPGWIWRFLFFSQKKSTRLLQQVAVQANEDMRIRPTERDVSELADRIETILDEISGTLESADLIGIAQSYEIALYSFCRRWFGEEGNVVAATLLAARGDNANARSGLDLWRLARSASDQPDIKSAVFDASDFSSLRHTLDSTRTGQCFLHEWDSFMATHGHHCRGELNLFVPRWSETPDQILTQLKSCITCVGEGDFLDRYTALDTKRAQAIKDALHRLRNPVNRAIFHFLFRRASRCATLRENLKSLLVRRLAALRFLCLEIGSRLAGDGTFSASEDIFFLRHQEIRSVLTGGQQTRDVTTQIAPRRAEYSRCLALTPPPVVVGSFEPQDDRLAESPATGTSDFSGVGVYPGIVTGPARVILRAGEDHVRHGEILVAPFTDPGWTPYFLNAAAIVMDMGGLLSHGSIIAREYGIPAVINVGPATTMIHTGQMIRVDGGKGTVQILPDPSHMSDLPIDVEDT